MKLKNLAILVILAVLLAGLAYYSAQKQKPSRAPSAIGAKVLPNLDVNRVGKLTITSKEGVTTVARSKDQWIVASRFNYPANFDKVADSVRELSELKIGQTVNVTPDRLADFKLVAPAASGGKDAAGAGALLELRDEKDGLLSSLLIGKGFMRQTGGQPMEAMLGMGGYSDGQYVQTCDGKVYLVSKSLDRLTESAKSWLADGFINVNSTDIREIEVSGHDRAPVKLARAKDGDSFALSDLRPDEGNPDSAKISQMTGALNNLGFDDVANPSLTLKETGLDRPIAFKATTRDGLIYNIRIGNALTNDTFDRYFTVSVTNEPAAEKPAPEDDKKDEKAALDKKNIIEQAAELNGKFSAWIYVMKSYRTEPMLFTRADLIKKPEPPKEGQTNAPAIKAEEKKSSKNKIKK